MQIDRIFNISNETEFEKLALEIYSFQYTHNSVYRTYVDQLNRPAPKSIQDIPFLPISFFKTHEIITAEKKAEVIFKSSGTGGERSRHYVHDLNIYKKSFRSAYQLFFGNPEEHTIIALLPNYIQQGDSSLVYMVDDLIKKSESKHSGFYLNQYDQLKTQIEKLQKTEQQVILIGVSYALLDFAEYKPDLHKVKIIETGGMKGRRKELTKEELHSTLKEAFNVDTIYSEYGMTELLSQAYITSELTFQTPPWMKVLIRDTNDPFSLVDSGRTGGINIIDLANLFSCSFIATQDLGKITDTGFEVIGRFDNSDIRGCNLLVQ
ncbi:MAG: acyl transferase [Bacteroidetes bacterium]|nr:MAG: acyl transferase [Bacteroidota bacterium]